MESNFEKFEQNKKSMLKSQICQLMLRERCILNVRDFYNLSLHLICETKKFTIKVNFIYYYLPLS